MFLAETARNLKMFSATGARNLKMFTPDGGSTGPTARGTTAASWAAPSGRAPCSVGRAVRAAGPTVITLHTERTTTGGDSVKVKLKITPPDL